METIKISDFGYPLPDERIAKYPLDRRDESKLLIYRGGEMSEKTFKDIDTVVPTGSLLVFNDTKVVRARIIMHKPSGARIEIFCLEPHDPADYERAFSICSECRWTAIVGNLKKWKEGALSIEYSHQGADYQLFARREGAHDTGHVIHFTWQSEHTFGQLLELLGRMPIPPYLNRESDAVDETRYQTVYSEYEGSVAAPTAGLHFTPEIISQMGDNGYEFARVTLHVGAGTFLPVKSDNVDDHLMHTEHFSVSRRTIELLVGKHGNITAVGTTSVRTLESLAALGQRILDGGSPHAETAVGQREPYDMENYADGKTALKALLDYMVANDLAQLKASTRIMIKPGYRFRVVDAMITNFHQPHSTLLLLVSAFVGDGWRKIYDYALAHDFRFLSYGDSSILLR